jgi:DNA-binding GntR family transcriptional regulator
MLSAPVSRPTQPSRLHDEILAKLRSMILRCELVPGTRISERDLCLRFGVSRTPLREALKVLASNGLVELLPNRGAWVPHLLVEDVSEVFDVLSLIERRAGELAASRLVERDLRELANLHDRMVAQALAGEIEKSIRLDFLIHRRLVDAAGSRTLSRVHEGLAVRVERARYIVGTSRSRMIEAVAEHEAILEAVLTRDPTRIADELFKHCVKTRDAVVEAVRTRFGDGLRRTG